MKYLCLFQIVRRLLIHPIVRSLKDDPAKSTDDAIGGLHIVVQASCLRHILCRLEACTTKNDFLPFRLKKICRARKCE